MSRSRSRSLTYLNPSTADRAKAEKKAAKEKKEKQLKAAANKRAKEKVEIAEGANPYLNPAKQAKGLPLQEHEDDFMASLLGDLDGKAQVKKTEASRPAQPAVRRTKPSLVKSAVAGSKRFAEAQKQAELRAKWPRVFSYKTWVPGKVPRVVYSRDEREVERVLRTLEG